MRRFPALRPELLALVTMTFASPAFAEPTPAKSPSSTEPAKTAGAQARTSGLTFGIEGGDLVLSDSSTLKIFRLHPLAAAVYALADGQRSFEAIRTDAEAASGYPLDQATLFAVLDALADANLLMARVTPPGTTELDAFVVVDGTLGTALVEPRTTKGTGVADLATAKRQEQAAKALERPNRVREAAYKSADDRLVKASEEGVKARGAVTEARRKEGSRKNSEEYEKQAFKTKASDDQALVVTRARSEQLAKSESTMRKVSEQEVKRMRPEEVTATIAARKVKQEADAKHANQEQTRKR